jgi:hypothetical protein
MIRPKSSPRAVQYRPLAAKTLRNALVQFISREFPRLGGPWIVDLFVDKVLQIFDTHTASRHRLQAGQTVWLAVAVDERPGYKSMYRTRHVPVVLTLTNPDDVAALRTDEKRSNILRRALVRVAREAYAQGGVLTCTELAFLFHHGHHYISKLIREYEAETGEVVPRRGNVHDMGGTLSHKAIICRKAFLEGKTTPVIAQETSHSPESVDRYLLDFARVQFATVQRGMTAEETAFAIQRPLRIVRQYVKLIEAFDLETQQIYARVGLQLPSVGDRIQIPEKEALTNEGREQAPQAD